MSYSIEEHGQLYTLSYRAYIKNAQGAIISPFHDIPAWANAEKTVVNMICEVPRWSNAKMEVNKGLKLNPITQDEKKGKPRFVHNCFPHHGYIWNYGAIPQTWENPTTPDRHTGAKGDNDPIDIVDIGEKVCTLGEVKQVKILGVMAMIDEGETDWKVIGIDVTDPLASQLNDVDDIDKVMPGQLAATNEWFRIYKIPAGKPENTFAFNGEAKNKDFAQKIIEETHDEWKRLMTAGSADISLVNTTVDGAHKITAAEASAHVASEPAHAAPDHVDPSVHKWHYVRL